MDLTVHRIRYVSQYLYKERGGRALFGELVYQLFL